MCVFRGKRLQSHQTCTRPNLPVCVKVRKSSLLFLEFTTSLLPLGLGTCCFYSQNTYPSVSTWSPWLFSSHWSNVPSWPAYIKWSSVTLCPIASLHCFSTVVCGTYTVWHYLFMISLWVSLYGVHCSFCAKINCIFSKGVTTFRSHLNAGYSSDSYFHTCGLSERPFPDTFTYTLVDPSRTRIWTKRLHLDMEFFQSLCSWPLHWRVSIHRFCTPRVQPTADVESADTESTLWDWSILRVWEPQGILQSIPHWYQETTVL